MPDFENFNNQENKTELSPEQFKANVENALNEALRQIDELKDNEAFPNMKKDLMERMEKIVLPGLDVKQNLDSMYNF